MKSTAASHQNLRCDEKTKNYSLEFEGLVYGGIP